MQSLRPATAADLPELHKDRLRRYAGDPCLVLPPREWFEAGLRKAMADPARFRLFVLESRTGICGSISVQLDPAGPEGVAWFGHFEADDLACTAQLVAHARAEAKILGAHTLRGPRGRSRFEFVGLTVQGHDAPPPLLQGHHKPAYAEWLEACGLERHHDHFAYHTPLVDSRGQPRSRAPA